MDKLTDILPSRLILNTPNIALDSPKFFCNSLLRKLSSQLPNLHNNIISQFTASMILSLGLTTMALCILRVIVGSTPIQITWQIISSSAIFMTCLMLIRWRFTKKCMQDKCMNKFRDAFAVSCKSNPQISVLNFRIQLVRNGKIIPFFITPNITILVEKVIWKIRNWSQIHRCFILFDWTIKKQPGGHNFV